MFILFCAILIRLYYTYIHTSILEQSELYDPYNYIHGKNYNLIFHLLHTLFFYQISHIPRVVRVINEIAAAVTECDILHLSDCRNRYFYNWNMMHS